MGSRRRTTPPRIRVGRVSLFFHHGNWWIYYRAFGKQVRRKIGGSREEAEQVAAQVNAQLTSGAPTLLTFTAINVPDLRHKFLGHHEYVLKSSVPTINRYRAATQHLENFALRQRKVIQAHEICPNSFAAHLRSTEVAPNGHPNTARRLLRDKGVQFILETCRSLYSFAAKQHHLPPDVGNPFAELPLDRLKIENAKPIFVFNAETELAFLQAADSWAFPIHFTLAKTGLRIGELTHLLIEELDLEGGWLHIRNKTSLGWRVKTGSERSVPVLPEVAAVLRRVISSRSAGPVFLRHRYANGTLPTLIVDRRELERVCHQRQRESGLSISRLEVQRIARTVWRDAGAIKADTVRTSFIQTLKQECTRMVMAVPLARRSLQRELQVYLAWYHANRPHTSLNGSTPDEVYFGQRPACRMPRFEPRPGWPRASPCARPQILVKGQPGVELELTIEFPGRRLHLPRVTLALAG